MTAYVIPCGLSVLDNLDRDRGKPAQARSDDRRRAMDALRTWQDNGTPDRADPDVVRAGFRAALEPVGEDLCLADWSPAVSAELSTLAGRVGGHGALAGLLAGGHAVVLLASETRRGMLAALLVATHIAGEDLDRVTLVATPQQLPASNGDPAAAADYPVVPGTVTIARISHLSEGVTDGFARATFGIGHVLSAVRDASRGGGIEVHLSGGHKATLLQTMALTEILKSDAAHTDATRHTAVTAWYLFEDSASASTRYPIEIGLRAFDKKTIVRMCAELHAVTANKKQKPLSSVLEGVGWTGPQHGEYKLTPFGWGYRALLGPLPPAAAG